MRKTSTIAAAALAVAGLVGTTAQAAPTAPAAGTAAPGAHRDAAARVLDMTQESGSYTARLRVALKRKADGSAPKLTPRQLRRLAAVGGELVRPGQAPTGVRAAARGKGPATLRCDKNPSWSDSRGTLHMRFNCRHNTVNWGFRISPRVQSVITGKVAERGASWWRNGKAMPKNAPHVVGKNYLFHGTFKTVRHGDHVQSQDYMKFPVRIGGRPGVGTLTWASSVKAKK